MPDKNGALTQLDKQKVADWINDKGSNHACPVCQQNNWSVGDHLLNGMIYTGGALVVGGTTYPSVFLMCKNCAYTRQFMAVPMGILETEAKTEEEENAS